MSEIKPKILADMAARFRMAACAAEETIDAFDENAAPRTIAFWRGQATTWRAAARELETLVVVAGGQLVGGEVEA